MREHVRPCVGSYVHNTSSQHKLSQSPAKKHFKVKQDALIPPCLFYPRQDGQVFGFTLIRIMAELGAIKRQEHCNFEQ